MFSPKKEGEVKTVVEEKKTAIADAKQIPQQLQDCPEDAIQLISNFLEYKDTVSLAHTCRVLYRDTKDSLLERKLAQYIVVEPNEDKVRAILTQNPKLINVVIKEAIDTCGRLLINNTMYQLAYGAGDDEMCLAMKPFFIQVYGSEEAAIEEMKKQCIKKFAEDEKADKQAGAHFASLLDPAIAAITAEQFNLGTDASGRLILNPATLAAIRTFREEFAKPKRVEKGMHFRNNTLLETYNAYVEADMEWDHDYKRCKLFEDGILSCVLLAVPVNDAQRFSQGLYYLQNEGEPFGRSLALRIGKNNFYLAGRGASVHISLMGTCVDIYRGMTHPNRGDLVGKGMRFIYQNLCKTKMSNLQSLHDLSSNNRRLDM